MTWVKFGGFDSLFAPGTGAVDAHSEGNGKAQGGGQPAVGGHIALGQGRAVVDGKQAEANEQGKFDGAARDFDRDLGGGLGG
jgi:hypothetical protein